MKLEKKRNSRQRGETDRERIYTVRGETISTERKWNVYRIKILTERWILKWGWSWLRFNWACYTDTIFKCWSSFTLWLSLTASKTTALIRVKTGCCLSHTNCATATVPFKVWWKSGNFRLRYLTHLEYCTLLFFNLSVNSS